MHFLFFILALGTILHKNVKFWSPGTDSSLYIGCFDPQNMLLHNKTVDIFLDGLTDVVAKYVN